MGIDWKALRAPIPAEDLEQVKKFGSGTLTYVDANAVCKRLDDVVGPENWKTSNVVMWDGERCPVVQCFLSIRVDGEWVTRDDFGYPNSMRREADGFTRKDSETGEVKDIRDGAPRVEDNEAIKSAATDALRRAAWRWGIGWELHEKVKRGPQASQERRSTGTTGGDAPAGVCPVHGVPWTQGQYGPYCKTKIGEKDGGGAIWCKEKPKAAAEAPAPAGEPETQPDDGGPKATGRIAELNEVEAQYKRMGVTGPNRQKTLLDWASSVNLSHEPKDASDLSDADLAEYVAWLKRRE